MRHSAERVCGFQAALESFGKTGASVSIFEDYKLEIVADHPLKDIRVNNYHDNQISKSTNDFILIQKNEIPQEDSCNGNDSTLDSTIKEDETQDSLCTNLTDMSIGNEVEAECPPGPKPVSIDKARFLMFLYTQCLRKSSFRDPVCILCDGQDPENTCLLEAFPIVQGSSLIGTTTTTASSTGPMHTKAELMPMDNLIKKASYGTATQCATLGFAQYDIMGGYYQHLSLPQNQPQTTVKLDCIWEGVKNVLETPHGAKCTVHIKAVPGDFRSAAHAIYSELKILVGFVSGLLGQIQWPLKKKDSTATSTVVKLLTELIENTKQGKNLKKTRKVVEGNGVDSDSVSSGVESKPIPERQDLDFTEQLWLLLKDNAHCYDDFVSSIKRVLQELDSGQLQPMVHSSNSTTMAKHIRASYHHNTTLTPALKDLDGLEPLRMLLEIGVDKLKRDYLAFFIGQELTTLDKLQWYLSPSNADSLGLEELVRRLQNLHSVMELYAVGALSLNLPDKTLWTLIRSGLAFYEQHQHTEHHTFSLQVDRSTMLRFYSSYQPSVWRVEVKGGSSDMEQTRIVYQVTTKNPFQHIARRLKSTSVLDQTGVEGDCFTFHETLATTSNLLFF